MHVGKEEYNFLEEVKAFYKVIALEMSATEVMCAFELLNTAKDGKINREEFTAAAEDFLFGVEETEISKLFFRPLLNWIFA